MSIKKMDAKAKAKWLPALRSGKFKQGHGGLVNNDGANHCCLGVLQCVAGDRKPRSDGMYLRPGRFGLPESVQIGLGKANDGTIDMDSYFKTTLGVDPPKSTGVHRRSSFKAIADWVEKHL